MGRLAASVLFAIVTQDRAGRDGFGIRSSRVWNPKVTSVMCTRLVPPGLYRRTGVGRDGLDPAVVSVDLSHNSTVRQDGINDPLPLDFMAGLAGHAWSFDELFQTALCAS